MSDDPIRLVVIGDSTSFTDHRGPQLPDEPTLYPNVLARSLEDRLGRAVQVTVVARAGQTVREAVRTVTKDRHVQFDVLAGADAVVVGVGSFDHAPGGIPPVVDAVVPYLRPAPVRRRVRTALHAAYPFAVRATGHRRRRTTPAEFERLFDLLLLQIRGLARGAAGVVLGPTSHRAAYYAHRHPGHAAAEAHHFAVAERHGFATVPVWPHVEPYADRLNPDGIHWPPEPHAAVGEALAERLLPQLQGGSPRPPAPSWG
jgi:hypothetical protein